MATDQRGLDYLSNTATDRITKDLDEFAQKIDPDDVNSYATNSLFLLSRGIDLNEYPSRLSLDQRYRIDLAIARRMELVRKNAERRLRTQFANELQTALGLVNGIVRTAKSNGQKKITMGYLELYLADSKVELSSKARRILLAKVNLELM